MLSDHCERANGGKKELNPRIMKLVIRHLRNTSNKKGGKKAKETMRN